ncbi:hypothetical protein SISSUDRAFT_1117010 [Sistotremastrum suecicum HHB10207 ss-3]|uniref:F-box domain-containing protein n=1 Tax=Sistotremastrum suecicum HHB10207 ss-3 TaxID=1314776 RepID=A0A166HB69_9AGAM|nr:hypothetical protein SISSUDRAFT_1117010 [Sistotremastrum suecicum HHB10207 ss-3]
MRSPAQISSLVLLLAVDGDPKTLLKLLPLCRAVYSWLAPPLYDTVTLANSDALLLFARTVVSNPHLALSVHSLWVGSLSHSSAFSPSRFDEEDWVANIFPTSICLILDNCRRLSRLALTKSIPLSIKTWGRIEERFPPHLKSLVLGPDHGMLHCSPAYKNLQRFYSIDTILSYVELRRIASFPALTYVQWRCNSHRLHERLGEKLSLILESPSLKTVKIVHDDVSMPHNWSISSSEQRVQFTRLCSSKDWLLRLHAEWRNGDLG